MYTIDSIREYLKYSPAKGPPAPANLRGWWTPVVGGDAYLCSACSGRLLARGCSVSGEAVWSDRPDPYGVCVGCQQGKEATHA